MHVASSETRHARSMLIEHMFLVDTVSYLPVKCCTIAGILDAFAWLAAVLDSAVLDHRAALERRRPAGQDSHHAPASIQKIGAGLHTTYFVQFMLQYLWGDEVRGMPRLWPETSIEPMNQ
jgi:hypothetical protein